MSFRSELSHDRSHEEVTIDTLQSSTALFSIIVDIIHDLRLFSNSNRSKVGTMISGTLILAVAFLVIGPCRYFMPKPNDHMTMAGVILIGFGFALAYVPTLDYLVDTAITDLGYLKSPSTYGPISGLWNFCNGFGETVGPVLAMFQTSSDFRNAALMISAALFSTVGAIRCFERSDEISTSKHNTSKTPIFEPETA